MGEIKRKNLFIRELSIYIPQIKKNKKKEIYYNLYILICVCALTSGYRKMHKHRVCNLYK